MSETEFPRLERRKPRRAPRPLSVRMRRRGGAVWKWLQRRYHSLRVAADRGRVGLERPPHWPRPRWRIRVVRYLVIAGAILLVALVVRAAVIVLGGDPGRFPLGFNPDAGCRDIGYSCGVANNVVMTFLTLAFGLALFLFYRMRRVREEYVRRARKHTAQLVQTSGTIIGDVVGREEICHVLMDDLRDRGSRRPHVVLGGVGVGKTAVLFRLTKILAEKGAVPVPLGLRQAQTDVDFVTLARERFVAEAATASLSTVDAERVWAELRKDDQIVVLADGLEEALSGADSRSDGKGDGDGDGSASTERDNRIRVAVRAARRQQLPLVIASRPHDAVSGLGLDAAVIELEPLGEEAALEYIEEGAPAEDALRVDWVIETAEVTETPFYLQIARELHQKGLLGRAQPERSRLNTRGLDRAALRFRLLDTWTRALIEGHFEPELPIPKELREATVAQLSALALMGLKDDRLEARFGDLLEKDGSGYVYGPLIERLKGTITQYRKEQDPAATDLVPDIEREIQLAATRGLRLRLVEPCRNGVRFPHSIMQAYLASREIRQVITEHPAYLEQALKHAGRELLLALIIDSRRDSRPPRSHETVRVNLLKAGGKRELEMAKRLDAFAAALEIDCVDVAPAQRSIAKELRRTWPTASEDQTVEEAKLRAVARFGAAARRISERRDKRKEDEPDLAAPAYQDLFRIARKDASYRVRLAAAQELGAGAEEARAALSGWLRPPRPRQVLDENQHRDYVLRAWLAPMLYGSVQANNEGAARAMLEAWTDRVRDECKAEDRLPLSLEIALAQGFKQAANRRPRHPHARRDARGYLAERAAEMLEDARFWFSRLTLVHALCLWALPESAESAKPARGREPRALVRHWLSSKTKMREHPFVAEACELAILALEQVQPERFIWTDETSVVTRIGARPPRWDAVRKHNLWIPPSAGWGALHPRAQRLVADVLLLLNLIERGAEPIPRERRLKRASREDLPPCLTDERDYLDPARTIGMATRLAPGANCKDRCPFDLCPYPEKGGRATYRVELSEAFCRRQRVLLGHWWQLFRRRTAPWQGATPGDLRRFWSAMEERARW